MILHAIELTYVGPFRETVRLGPFAPGLNLLCAPNETGKSTAMRATARALFDRHTTKGDELKAFQPAGTDLAPRVAVEFETRAGRFRIEKTFLLSPRSLLQQWQSGAWQPIAEADAADQRVQALLSSALPGKGATKPEHWGFLGFLWARQGEPVEWPGLDDAAVGQQIRARLARVELDPIIEQLRARLGTASDAILTSKGLPKANGPLDAAEKEIAGIESELAALQRTRAVLDGAHQRFVQANATVAQLEKEYTEREHAAALAREQALTLERLRGELEARQLALTAAQEKLTVVAADTDTLARHRGEKAAVEAAVAQAELTVHAAEKRGGQLRRQLEELQAMRPTHETLLTKLRTDHERVQSLLKLRQFSAQGVTLSRQLAKAESAAAEVAALEDQRTRLPTFTPVKLRKLEELAETVRTLRAQLQALGLTVELTPDAVAPLLIVEGEASREQVLPAGESTRLYRPQALELQLVGWGRVVIRSGAQDAQTAASRLAASETSLREALQEMGVTSIEAARQAVTARKDLDTRHHTALATLNTLLGDYENLADLRVADAGMNLRVEALMAVVRPTVEEQERHLADHEAAEAQLTEAIPAAEKALKACDRQLELQRTEEREAAKAMQVATQLVGDHQARLRTLETQMRDLSNRYAGEMEAAKGAAQLLFTQAEARVAATKAELPVDFERLPERNKRAAMALQQLTNELQWRRAERDEAKGTLETVGGQGLYSRETDLEEKKTDALQRRDAARNLGWSTRIVHDLIEYRKQAATKAVLMPLEQRLTAAFGELTGDNTREVFLDEHLQIAGLGRTRESAYAFDHLSQGAKEQLLLCLRIAVAQELAVDEPQVLILDDVLVNTDATRQERVLDVLATLSAKLQILILTCHAERYRGVGASLTLARSC